MDKAVKKARTQLRKNEQERFNGMCANAINNQAAKIEQLEKQIEDAKIKNRAKRAWSKIRAMFKKEKKANTGTPPEHINCKCAAEPTK